FATADVDFVFQSQGHCLVDVGFAQVAVEGDDFLHFAGAPRGQGHHGFARADHAGGDGAAKTPEVEVGAGDVLYRKAEVFQVLVPGDLHGFEDFHQWLAGEPGRVLALVHHVVAVQGGNRHKADVLQAEFGGKGQVFVADFIEALFAEVHQVHLVHRHHNVANAQKGGDERVPAGLGHYAVAGVD